MPDHDLCFGLLVCPNGYMNLTAKPGFVDKQKNMSAKSMADDTVEPELLDNVEDEFLSERLRVFADMTFSE